MTTECLGVDFLGALRHLAKFSGYWPEGLTDAVGQVQPKAVPTAPPKPRVSEDHRRRWHIITPVPSKVPAPRLGTFEAFIPEADRRLHPTLFWPYYDGNRQLLGCDVRYEYDKPPHPVNKAGKCKLWGEDVVAVEVTADTVTLKDGRKLPNALGWYFSADDRVEVLHDGRIVTAEEIDLADPSRIRLSDGRWVLAGDCCRWVKAVITWTWCQRIDDGTQQWRQRKWDDPSPLYGLDRLAARPTDGVVICEGCKAATAADARTGLVGMSWRGGCDSAADFDKNDWSPLAGRDVVIWPDADDGGRKAAWHIAQHLHRVNAARVRVVDTAGLPKGWDLADD
jgi:hypothetical protein